MEIDYFIVIKKLGIRKGEVLTQGHSSIFLLSALRLSVSLSLFLRLSHSHTHTHTHSLIQTFLQYLLGYGAG